ncbi:MAG: ATP-binding protein [Candidatus Promineifilaceae bacterium]|nr:ATP-binding protein [Candidatus Promineifilaceae bacterium]
MSSRQRASQLLELLRASPAQQVVRLGYQDQGVADLDPFPFLALIGQTEMKLALILALINPLVGGVLLLGPRGTGKTTAVRALTDLLPERRQSLCPEGCTEILLEERGMEGICLACAEKVGYGKPLSSVERVRIFHLPLNARLEDVVGGIDERVALEQQRVHLERGLLTHADGHILYIDEVNLLDRPIANAILDAAAQGQYTVRRGAQKLTYRSRFLLVGSMNPEEGALGPQLMDRFGLRAVVRGLGEPDQRFQAYQQASWYRRDPAGMTAAYAEQTLALAEEIQRAKERLVNVGIGDEARELGLRLVEELQIDSGRAEITLFEAARAHAAADERLEATEADIRAVSFLALRFRRSGLASFFEAQEAEDERVQEVLDSWTANVA